MRKTTKRKYRRRKLGDGIKAAIESDKLKRRTEPHKAPEHASMLKTVFRDGERFGKVEAWFAARGLTLEEAAENLRKRGYREENIAVELEIGALCDKALGAMREFAARHRSLFLIPLVLLASCSAKEDAFNEWVQRADKASEFCSDKRSGNEYYFRNGTVDANWYSGCVSGFMNHCSTVSCPRKQ